MALRVLKCPEKSEVETCKPDGERTAKKNARGRSKRSKDETELQKYT